VGTGTVSRHFPTKEGLFQAVFVDRVQRLADRARALAGAADPGAAFLEFFALVVAEGAANRGLAEALAGAGFDLEAAAGARGTTSRAHCATCSPGHCTPGRYGTTSRSPT
jgi:AcrR family transcriptional regulator